MSRISKYKSAPVRDEEQWAAQKGEKYEKRKTKITTDGRYTSGISSIEESSSASLSMFV